MDILRKDLLVMLDIPCMNQEEFSCPKGRELVQMGFGYEVWDCGHHKISDGVHGTTMQCQILFEWIDFKINQLKATQ